MPKIDFTVMGFSEKDSDMLNWCVKHLDNLEVVKRNEIMEIWEEKNVEGNAVLNFNNKGVLLRTKKELFSV